MVLSIAGYYDFINTNNKDNEFIKNHILKIFFNQEEQNSNKKLKINNIEDILILKENFKNKILKPILLKHCNSNQSFKRIIKENSGYFGQELNIFFGLLLKEFGLENIILFKKCFINKNEISFHIGLQVSLNHKEFIIDCSKDLLKYDDDNNKKDNLFSNDNNNNNEVDISIEDLFKLITDLKNDIKKPSNFLLLNNVFSNMNNDTNSNNTTNNFKLFNNNFIKKQNSNCFDEFINFFNQGITLLDIKKIKIEYDNNKSKIIYPSNNQNYNELLKYFLLCNFFNNKL